MALLIALLAKESTLEVHVFGPGGGGGGGGSGSSSSSGNGSRAEDEKAEKVNGDPVDVALRSVVRHWHQVLARETVTIETEECRHTLPLLP